MFKTTRRVPKNPLLKDSKGVSSQTDRQQPSEPEYDIIIVGGGTAGCVLASRLSEDPTLRILLLESGESSVQLLFSIVPAAFTKLFRTKYDYGLTTVPQQNAGGACRYWPRARLLGGCSAINAMILHHAAPSDYDEWPRFLGKTKNNSIWSYAGLKKYFLKFENFIPPEGHPVVDASERGASGPLKSVIASQSFRSKISCGLLSAGRIGHNCYITQQFFRACETVGIPVSPDVNTSQGTLGVTKSIKFVDQNGRRVTAENAYLTSEVLKRPNLRVLTSSTVTKVIFEDGGHEPRAVGVEFASSRDGPRFRVRAKKEVILCAGAVHTPQVGNIIYSILKREDVGMQVLLLSGIGSAAQLAFHGISPLVDLPGVGEHLMDHPAVGMNLLDKSGRSLGWMRKAGPLNLKLFSAVLQWVRAGSGPLTTNFAEGIAFIRADDPNLFQDPQEPLLTEDSTSGPECPDIELLITPIGYGPNEDPPEPSFGMRAVALRPTSLGTISLRSNDPFDNPAIDPRYLSTQHDVDVLVKGVKILLRLLQAEPLASNVVDGSGDGNPALDHHICKATTVEIEEFVRQKVDTLYHPTSTARMAKREDGGVVDEELKVYGVQGLRVVDASIFPTIPAGHTVAPTFAVAEKMADLIKVEYAKV